MGIINISYIFNSIVQNIALGIHEKLPIECLLRPGAMQCVGGV